MANTTNVITNVGFGAEGLSVSTKGIVGDYFKENNTVFPNTGDMEYYLNTKISPVFEQNTDVLNSNQTQTTSSFSKSSGPYIWKYQ